jgi:hypothetical protein
LFLVKNYLFSFFCFWSKIIHFSFFFCQQLIIFLLFALIKFDHFPITTTFYSSSICFICFIKAQFFTYSFFFFPFTLFFLSTPLSLSPNLLLLGFHFVMLDLIWQTFPSPQYSDPPSNPTPLTMLPNLIELLLLLLFS